MISQTGLNKVADNIKGLISNARYTLDNTTSDIAINKTELIDNVLHVYVLFDESYTGNLTKVELIDVDGAVFADQPDDIAKDERLLLVTFKFTVTEVIN